MESSWRRNVWEMGLGWTDATLCSRLLGTLNFYQWITNERRPDQRRVIWTILDTVPELPYFKYLAGPGRGNFPFQWPVEPDVPL